MNFITRKGKFDAGHRVMHERFKCFNVHGHEYRYEMTFVSTGFDDLGYAVDFKELKRVGCQWIDDNLDHCFIANPADKVMIDACAKLNSKIYIMSLRDKERDGENFCNPTAENTAKELFFAMSILLNQAVGTNPDKYKLKLVEIKLHETVDCFVKCTGLTEKEWAQLLSTKLYHDLCTYREQKGSLEYDERKVGVSE